MISRHRDYADTESSGFSSLLAHATAAVNPSAASGFDASFDVLAVQERSPPDGKNGNRNLSSIVAQIQDDGPALKLAEDTVHLSGVNKTGINAHKNTPTVTAGGSIANPGKTCTRPVDKSRRAAAEPDAAAGPAPQQAPDTSNRNGWPQLVATLVFGLAGVMCFSVYTLIDQADELIDSLRQQGESLRVAGESQNSSTDILPLVSSLNEEIRALKNEFQSIRNDYRDTENRLSMKIPDDLADQLIKINSTEGNDDELQNNLQHIRHEIAEMKQVIRSVRGTVVSAPAPAPTQVQAQVHSGDWVVNLASLSSRDKAQRAVKRLEDSGIAPVIQEAIVNGEKVYRLSVAGFFTRGDATVFINKARKEFGFDGGWIRRS